MAAYVSDIALTGMMHVTFARSLHAQARLRAIDVTAARTAPGVGIMTEEDATIARHRSGRARRWRRTSRRTSRYSHGRETQRLPPGTEPGLDATRFYDPILGIFAAGAQAAVVEVDPATGLVTIRRFVCVEATGRIINPLIVEGQVHGAIAQGIGGALFECLVYDDAGQLVTDTLMDYAVPTATMIPPVEILHIEEPPGNLLEVRGVGEGGTLGPADALAPFGVETNTLPLAPWHVWSAEALAVSGTRAPLT